MARLVEAVRSDARLVLVGDPEQLASVEAGAVLGDVVGPATMGLRMTPTARADLAKVAGTVVDATEPPDPTADSTPIGDGIVVLRRVHSFGDDIARLASSVKMGDVSAVLDVLRSEGPAVTWIDDASAIGPVRQAAVEAGRAMLRSAKSGEAGRGDLCAESVSSALRSPTRSREAPDVGSSHRAVDDDRNRRFRA